MGLGATRAIVPPTVGDLVITEVMPDPTAVDDANGEWFEVLVKNQSDLNGLVLANEGTGTANVTASNCINPPSGTALVFAKTNVSAVNGGLPTVTSTFSFSLSNSGTRRVEVRSNGTVIDDFPWTASTPGASLQLTGTLNGPADNNVSTNVCPTPTANRYGASVLADGGVGPGDRGTPGAPNVNCPP